MVCVILHEANSILNFKLCIVLYTLKIYLNCYHFAVVEQNKKKHGAIFNRNIDIESAALLTLNLGEMSTKIALQL